MNYTLDTNIVLSMLRNKEFKVKFENKFGFDDSKNSIMISVVSVGELHALALKNKWGKKKVEALEVYLEDFYIFPILNKKIISIYANIDAFSQNKLPLNPLKTTARNMGKNDLWIAATAVLTNSQLLTTDQDFSHLNESILDLQLIHIKDYI